MANDRLDIVIFGATGYTGKYAVKHAARLCKDWQINFGVAGRRKEALEAVVKEFAPDIENVPIILADVKDEESLKEMTKQAKVLANCCGPYRFYGEAVIKACIATRTNHVDVSGEPQYMESMQLKYNEAAQKAGIYIVSACGFDSIPIDMGIIFTQKKFEGEVNSIEAYMKMKYAEGKPIKDSSINYGTWESAVYGLAHANELRELRRKLYPDKLPEFTPKLKSKGKFHQCDISEGWSMTFEGSDRSVARRTQRFLYDKYKERPVQIQTYMTFKSLCNLVVFAFFGIIFVIMTRMECTRNLLLKYPSIFSGGYISRTEPKPEIHERVNFSTTFKAKGWSEKLTAPTDKHINLPNKELITKVSGTSPAYDFTCIALFLSAIMILTESDKMPDNGGVLPPGAAFGKTSLIDELMKQNIKFEVISSTEK